MKNPPNFSKQSGKCWNPVMGFTLIEVLVVVTIISILITAGVAGLGNLSGGKGTGTAIATCESLFEEARTIAVSKRTTARVMIDVDNPDDDNYLRRVVIAYQDPTAADPKPWKIDSRGYVMPGGTYFSKDYSLLADRTEIKTETLSGSDIPSSYQKEYAYYEFNAEGIFAQAGANFVIASGARPKGQEPKVTKSAENDFAGFVIWRNGSTSTYRSTQKIEDHTGKALPSSGQNF